LTIFLLSRNFNSCEALELSPLIVIEHVYWPVIRLGRRRDVFFFVLLNVHIGRCSMNGKVAIAAVFAKASLHFVASKDCMHSHDGHISVRTRIIIFDFLIRFRLGDGFSIATIACPGFCRRHSKNFCHDAGERVRIISLLSPKFKLILYAPYVDICMKILLAMSGGVDSSVVAHLLKEQGHDVIGVRFTLWTDPLAPALAQVLPSKCCTTQNISRASAVAKELGIPLKIVNLEDEFKKSVVDPYLASHLKGETPNPCIGCNRNIKFGKLLQLAEELGCEKLATGHYARLAVERLPDGSNRWILL
jgi:hypothetical protein